MDSPALVSCVGDEFTAGGTDAGAGDGTLEANENTHDAARGADATGMVDALADATEGADGFMCDPSKTPSEEACVIADGLGVFVSPMGSDMAGAGTKESPFATVGYALKHMGSVSRVYICNGAFHEMGTVRIVSPVGLFGGLTCPTGTSTDWSHVDGGVASITMAPDQVALEIVGVSGAVDVEDLALSALPAVGMDDAGNGLSSVAVVVDHSNVTFRRCTMSAGNGADGADGGTGSNYTGGSNAPNGQAGDDGGNGGAGGLVVCTDGTSSLGGVGGTGTLTSATNGGDGGAVPMPPTAGGFGAGGAAGMGASACTPGNLGANGLPGSGGAAANAGAYGTWTDGGWLPTAGGAGSSGNPGQGGGGGGGKRALPGTGGGAGGCGGAGGRGGGGGGASFALVCLSSSVTLDTCTLMTGRGGRGGNGSDGQPGQGGGNPATPIGFLGCLGGPGGNGAGGAGGAGGTGGSSACILYQGALPSGTPTCSPGAGGIGGAGGKGASGGDTVPDQNNPGAVAPAGTDGGAGASQASLGL